MLQKTLCVEEVSVLHLFISIFERNVYVYGRDSTGRTEFNCNAPHLEHHHGLARYAFSLS